MTMKIILIVLVFLLFYGGQPSYQGNILGLFPHFGYSHFKVFYPILYGLVERGHKVTVVTFFPNKNFHPNYTEILLKKPNDQKQIGETHVHVFELDNFAPTRSLSVLFKEFMALHWEGQNSCRGFYESGVVRKLVESHSKEPFDIAILENFNTDCYLGVTHLLQVPIIGVSSCALMPWFYDRIALPDTPSYVQTEFVGFPDQLDWQQRLINFIVTKTCKIAYRYTNWKDNKIVKEFLNIDVDVNQIANDNTSFILVNQHYSLIGNRPSSPQLIEIGGIHIDEKEEPLTTHIEDFLMKSPNGVLFISWGSMLKGSSIAADKVKMIVEALQKLPLRIIWKWENDNLPSDANNEKFLFIKWAPQKEILCHPKVKIFWGHGGLLGVTEAVYCAKPMLITPVYGDQFLNANSVESRKIGKILLYNDISVEALSIALQEIMSKKYADNAVMISKIFRNRDMSPLDKAMWWIEHVLENRNYASDVMRVKSFHMPWVFFYSLDSIAIILGFILIPFYVGCRLVSLIIVKRNRKQHRD